MRSRARPAAAGRLSSRFRVRDLGGEVLAGLLQRPGRSALTLVGTVLGIASFVAIVGLSQTTSGQIGAQFSRLDATQVRVADTAASKASVPTLDFPADADQLAGRIRGVIAAGVWWMPQLADGSQVAALPRGARLDVPLVAATPQPELFEFVRSEGIAPIGYCPVGSPARPRVLW